MKKKKRRRKVPARVQLRRLEKKADAALSLYVRAKTALDYNGKCPICGRGPLIPNKPTRRDPREMVPAIQCNFHFVRRRRKIVRWNVFNVIGACHRCNYQEYRDPDISRAWYINTYGVSQYLSIVRKSREPLAPSAEYLNNIIRFYTEQLAKLENPEKG